MLILGIESTCDETSAAVVADGVNVRSNIVASQVELHARYRGVVPEIASRAHIEQILPVISESLAAANVTLKDIDAIAVAHRPGLIGSLLIGVTCAKSLAWILGKPLIGVDHVQAHLYSVRLDAFTPSTGTPGEGGGGGLFDVRTPLGPLPNPPPEYQGREPLEIPFPAIGLVCSGGHTALYRMENFLDVVRIGSTIDDAVGEAYDKVAAILGLGYPGGPVIDRLAREGNGLAIKFPRSRLKRDSLDFSFSGLKTAVLYHVRGFQGREKKSDLLSPTELRDIAASFQAACVDVLIEKIRRAIHQCGAASVIVGGGVSANSGLRAALPALNIPVFFPPLRYCTDNAAMIAGLGHALLLAGRQCTLDLDAIPYSQITIADPAKSAADSAPAK